MGKCSKCGKEVENVFVIIPMKEDEDEVYKCLACFMKDHWKFEKGRS